MRRQPLPAPPSAGADALHRPGEQAQRRRVQHVADRLRRLAREGAGVRAFENDAELEAGHDLVPVDGGQIAGQNYSKIFDKGGWVPVNSSQYDTQE